MSTVQKQSARAQQTVEALEPNEFSDLLQREFKPKTDQAREAVQNAVKTLAVQALESSVTISNDAYRTVQAIITEIDRKLSEQINQILHHEDFQQLEGAWRGLHYLVNNTETDEQLKIRVMCASKREVARSLKRHRASAGTRARCSRRSTRPSTASSAASPSAR